MVLQLEKKVSPVVNLNNYFYIRLGNKIESNNKKNFKSGLYKWYFLMNAC